MSTEFKYDASYLKSISGVLKISCLTCCFFGFICILCSSVHLHNFRACFYNTIVLFAFVCTSSVLGARLFQLWQHKFYIFNAVKCEYYLHVFLAFACFIAASTTISLDVTAYTIATFFALLAFSFYALDAYLGYRLSRQRDVQTQTEPQTV
uniref:MARVEL domain-containing protein n=1 Tax=Glossina morsitans morsitans TaxID=37546 RepID=A0A1B0FLZ4_GLOMM